MEKELKKVCLEFKEYIHKENAEIIKSCRRMNKQRSEEENLIIPIEKEANFEEFIEFILNK